MTSDGASREVFLVVDDDRPFCLAVAGSLRRRGHRVLVAHERDEGLREARAFRPTHAVVDLRMPGGGLELVRELKEELPDIRVVVLTGYGSIATAVNAIKSGAVQYLTKPVSVDQLLVAFEGEQSDPSAPEVPSVPASLDEVEWEHLQRVLAEAGGNVSEAARRLGLHRRSLQRKLARHPPRRRALDGADD